MKRRRSFLTLYVNWMLLLHIKRDLMVHTVATRKLLGDNDDEEDFLLKL